MPHSTRLSSGGVEVQQLQQHGVQSPQRPTANALVQSLAVLFRSAQFSHSVVSDSLRPMDCSTPRFPVHPQLREFTQTHVHRVGDAIQPSHPLSSPSPPTFNLSQHQSFQMSQLFTSGGHSIGVSASTSFLPMNLQD